MTVSFGNQFDPLNFRSWPDPACQSEPPVLTPSDRTTLPVAVTRE